MEWLGFVLLGLMGGMLSGFFGVGGGVIMVPMLVYVMGFAQKEAQGTCLAVLAVPVVAVAAYQYYANGYVRLNVVGWVILGFVLGAYCGAVLVAHVPNHWLQRAFGLVLLFTGIEFLLAEEGQRTRAVLPAAVASVAVWLFTVWRRRSRAAAQRAADQEPDYHI